MSSKEKYEKIIKLYKHSIVKNPKGFHTHHIYPKSIWPDAKDEPEALSYYYKYISSSHNKSSSYNNIDGNIRDNSEE